MLASHGLRENALRQVLTGVKKLTQDRRSGPLPEGKAMSFTLALGRQCALVTRALMTRMLVIWMLDDLT